jgi:hypothetical protein
VDKLNNKILAMINNNVNFIGKRIRNSTKINSADWWKQVSNDMGKNKRGKSKDMNPEQMDNLNSFFADICSTDTKTDYNDFVRKTSNNIEAITISQVYKSLKLIKKNCHWPRWHKLLDFK